MSSKLFFAMKYRIIQKGNREYRIQIRSTWIVFIKLFFTIFTGGFAWIAWCLASDTGFLEFWEPCEDLETAEDYEQAYERLLYIREFQNNEMRVRQARYFDSNEP